MTFLTDKEELKPGLVIFRRADVRHRNWYCRIKVPKPDRYKTLSLKTADIAAARDRAYDHDADLRFRVEHDVPIFNRSFSQIAKERGPVRDRYSHRRNERLAVVAEQPGSFNSEHPMATGTA